MDITKRKASHTPSTLNINASAKHTKMKKRKNNFASLSQPTRQTIFCEWNETEDNGGGGDGGGIMVLVFSRVVVLCLRSIIVLVRRFQIMHLRHRRARRHYTTHNAKRYIRYGNTLLRCLMLFMKQLLHWTTTNSPAPLSLSLALCLRTRHVRAGASCIHLIQ